MAMHEIIPGIPIPKIDRSHKSRWHRYPFETMKIGEMIFIPDKEAKVVGSYVSRATKKLPSKWLTRTVWMRRHKSRWELSGEGVPGAIKGAGVWRIA